jgi:hypothetical protein
MKQHMYDVTTVEQWIQNGERLILAGDEKVLNQLPPGSWIGGTIPYFMTVNGGLFSQEKIYVTQMPDSATDVKVKTYTADTIDQVYLDAPPNGFSIIILPAFSKVHAAFALNSPSFEGFATSPLVGWISGVSLDEAGQVAPKTYAGNGNGRAEQAVVCHIELPPTKAADVQIVNIFQQGDGDTITFASDGFSAEEACVNGQPVNFASYIQQNGVDTRLPLVANLHGAMINTSFQQVDLNAKKVDFYAPVFAGIEYRVARPVDNYVHSFQLMVPTDLGKTIYFSCNCILNYLYADLEGKQLLGITGPITFGEVAYQLLNQTMAYVVIEDI